LEEASNKLQKDVDRLISDNTFEDKDGRDKGMLDDLMDTKLYFHMDLEDIDKMKNSMVSLLKESEN
jgi:hypothetical protein